MRKMSIKGVLNLFLSMSLISTDLTAGACALGDDMDKNPRQKLLML